MKKYRPIKAADGSASIAEQVKEAVINPEDYTGEDDYIVWFSMPIGTGFYEVHIPLVMQGYDLGDEDALYSRVVDYIYKNYPDNGVVVDEDDLISMMQQDGVDTTDDAAVDEWLDEFTWDCMGWESNSGLWIEGDYTGANVETVQEFIDNPARNINDMESYFNY